MRGPVASARRPADAGANHRGRPHAAFICFPSRPCALQVAMRAGFLRLCACRRAICAPVRARVRCGKAADMSRGAQPVARAAAQSVVRPLSVEPHDSHVAVSWRVRRPRPRSPLSIPAAIAGWRNTARGPSGRTVQLSMSRAALAAADGANALRTVRLRRRAYLQRAGRAVRRWLPAVNVKFRYNGVRRRQNRPARPRDAAIAFDLHGDVW